MGATHHLGGNAEHEGHDETRGSLWEMLMWMQTLYWKDEKRWAAGRKKKCPSSQYKTLLEFKKEKMDGFWSNTVSESPYYYASTD